MRQLGANGAARLTETGFAVLGYDVNPARPRERAECQVAMADTARAALTGRPVVLTSLPGPAAIRVARRASGYCRSALI